MLRSWIFSPTHSNNCCRYFLWLCQNADLKCIESLDEKCTFVEISDGQQVPIRQLTNGSEHWNAQPQNIYSIKNLNVSKAGNKYPKASFDNENPLYILEKVCPVNQVFHGHPILRKCKIVHVCIFASKIVSDKWSGRNYSQTWTERTPISQDFKRTTSS